MTGHGDADLRFSQPRQRGTWSARMLSLDEPVRPLWQQLLLAGVTAAVCTLICWPLAGFFPLAELVMVYLLGVIVASTQLGTMASAVTAVVCAACFDFFFVIPRFDFVPSDLKHLATVIGLLAVGLVVSSLTGRLRHQVAVARWERSRVAALFALSRELARTATAEALAQVAADEVARFFGAPAFLRLMLGGQHEALLVTGGVLPSGVDWEDEVMRSAPERAQNEGRTVHTVLRREPGGRGGQSSLTQMLLCSPLLGARGVLGALGIVVDAPEDRLPGWLEQQLELFAAQAALAIERARLEAEAEAARVHAETERLRSALLSSVSHDLRTPLGAITGASSALLDDDALLRSPEGRDLLAMVNEEANRLNRLVGNLLEMTRLEAGALEPKVEWQPVEEVIGSALGRLASLLEGRSVVVHVEQGVPPVQIDGVLIEQALRNVLDNACRYAPPGSAIEVAVSAASDGVLLTVADRGPGLPPGDEARIFDKFYRGLENGAGRPGVGLGLAVARGIVEAHGGRIWACNREGGGAVFSMLIPLPDLPAELRADGTLDEEEA